MKTISMLELRKDAENIIRQVQQGEHFVLTYRGKPAARLEPVKAESISTDDPFYQLSSLADEQGESLTNEAMDALIYES